MSERFGHYARLLRLDRPIGALLLLWPTLWGLWIAGAGQPDPKIVVIFVAGVFVMRSAGCVINDYADRNFDPHVARTRNRPLATGAVNRVEALSWFAVLSLAALGLVSMLNGLTIGLAVAGMLIAATYPFLKRFTHLPQLYLGVAFSWGIPMAFAAHGGAVPGVAWVLMLGNLLWVVAYDTLYAMVDRDDDLKAGVKSLAILAGRFDLALVAGSQLCGLGVLVWLGRSLGLNAYYFAGVAAAAGFSIYQLGLARQRRTDKCFKAFLNNAWWGAVVFAGIVLAYL
ncbi:MAG: 4-hydroxybenzoate octaprenyltransferase [Gammaproteobacteria bacterium]|nr:4-hydroxybenzoate octaprenyltransferase [Gammaproteobacteria bacterium]MDH3467152.1 4-hydroxybenzoate octaprenyltransferase [Gammaproteobacteria bacterium]